MKFIKSICSDIDSETFFDEPSFDECGCLGFVFDH